MQKKHLLAVALILLLGITYLFYHLCKRDTSVIEPAAQLSVPDSSWLYGSFNLKQIRKDIAWSSLFNGDISKLFEVDTNSNTLLKIFRSPADYAITEQNNIRYFSIWKNKKMFSGLLFTLEDHKSLLTAFKSDSLNIQKKTAYSFRTKEGYWLYNNQNLLFIAQQDQDSILARSIFNHPSPGSIHITANDSLYISCNIRTQFYQDSIQYPLTDTSVIQLAVKANTEYLDIDWSYTGSAVNYFNQVSVTEPAAQTGLYAACSPTPAGLEKLLQVYMSHTAAQKLPVDLHPFISILQNNTLSVEFNGWDKLLQSFYRYEMNEEFETVMVKKDSFYLEPTFRIVLAGAENKEMTDFFTYLHKAGLISQNKKPPFKATLGNFNSELKVSKDSSLIFQNSHPPEKAQADKIKDGIFFLTCKPDNIQGLFDQKEFKERTKFASVAELNISGYKKGTALNGHVQVLLKEDKHPIISAINLLKK